MEEKKSSKIWVFAIGIFVISALALFFFGGTISTGFFSLSNEAGSAPKQVETQLPALNEADVKVINTDSPADLSDFESELIDPADFPVRENFFREVYQPRRETYRLFDRAGKFLGKDLQGVKNYFGLESESEIFEELPPVPEDFSEIAVLLATGKYFSIGLLEEEYFKQPEFYSNFKSLGVKYWTQPDPKYWTTNGYGAYPAEQFDNLTINDKDEFRGVVFVYTAWGVQTYQGLSLDADPESKKYFDIEITPKNILLGPVWPKFSKNWAYKVEIRGKRKQDTPAGNYKVGINLNFPPQELREQWLYEHKNTYFDALNAIRPSGNLIEFNVEVKEK